MKDAPVRHLVEYSAFLGVRSFLRLLPHGVARRLGRWIGRLGHRLLARHRRIARINLEHALPELSADQRRAVVRRCFEHFGLALCDTISARRFSLEELCRRLDLEGWENLQEAEARARERGVGTFLLTGHVGLWEMAAYAAGLYGGPVDVIGRPLDNPWLDRELARARRRFGNRLIPKQGAVRPMFRAIGRGGRVGILIDQRARAGEGIWVPFFGLEAYSTPILARLALRTGAPVVPMFAYPEAGGRYRVAVEPAIWSQEVAGLEREAAEAELTRRYLEVIERAVRKRPEMWLWMHDRWGLGRGSRPGNGAAG